MDSTSICWYPAPTLRLPVTRQRGMPSQIRYSLDSCCTAAAARVIGARRHRISHVL